MQMEALVEKRRTTLPSHKLRKGDGGGCHDGEEVSARNIESFQLQPATHRKCHRKWEGRAQWGGGSSVGWVERGCWGRAGG